MPAVAEPAIPWKLEDFVVPPKEGAVRFHDIGLHEELMRAVADLGFQYCTPIQAGVLQLAITGRDVAGQAQTGTGKTAAFLLSVFERFLIAGGGTERTIGSPRALILAPTRELVIQIVKDAKNLGRHTPFRAVALYGGMDLDGQRREMAAGPVDIVAATPGRLLDFCGRDVVRFDKLEVLVIDEADRMLDMGFIPDVKRILRRLPPREKRQTLLFSATLSGDVRNLAGQWMVNPVDVIIEPEKVTVDTIDQIVYTVPKREKIRLLYNLLQERHMSRVLVFTNRRDRTQRVFEDLEAAGVSCGVLSGDTDQRKRIKVLEQFRQGEVRVLVATDVAARGLHIDDVSHVVNFDLPYEPEDYVHRIGRTGRAGTEGTAISFACEDESFTIPEIEAFIGRTLPCRMPEEQFLREMPRRSHAGGHHGGHGSHHGHSGPHHGHGGPRRETESPGGARRPAEGPPSGGAPE